MDPFGLVFMPIMGVCFVMFTIFAGMK